MHCAAGWTLRGRTWLPRPTSFAFCESITYEEFGLDDGTSDLAKVGRTTCSALSCKAYAASNVPTLLDTAVSRSSAAPIATFQTAS